MTLPSPSGEAMQVIAGSGQPNGCSTAAMLIWAIICFEPCPFAPPIIQLAGFVIGRDAMLELKMACDGGKDSLSMASNADGEVVKAPGNLVVSAYVGCPDITATVCKHSNPTLRG